MQLADFDYALPPERIAQVPPPERDAARLLRVERRGSALDHRSVSALPELLRSGDLLVVNTTRVVRARLRGSKETGGAAEALLLGPGGSPGEYRALLRCRGRLRVGQKFRFTRGEGSQDAEIRELGERGEVLLVFVGDADPHALGEMPLPPYIRRPSAEPLDEERYQTVFAREPGSVAAPTAGLHLTKPLLALLEERGVSVASVVLHVGAGTFRPLEEADLAKGSLHPEFYTLPDATADAIAATRAAGGRVVAVGTTSARVLESCANDEGTATAGEGETRLFLRPGSPFQLVDGLLTNFHLPRSSLLLLVCAFAGRERVLAAYAKAVASDYRFYSYGDAMLIL